MHIHSPLGDLTLVQQGDALAAVRFGKEAAEGQEGETPLLNETKRQLFEYFSGKRKCFDLPLRIEGTAFQKRVWNAMLDIPYGKCKSYSEIAAEAGSPRACRAVGSACRANPLLIILPCHRVVGGKDIGGYAEGIEAKAKLLQLEKYFEKDIDSGQILDIIINEIDNYS